jgi:hypothetical protein
MSDKIIQIVITKTANGYKIITFSPTCAQESVELTHLYEVISYISAAVPTLVKP